MGTVRRGLAGAAGVALLLLALLLVPASAAADGSFRVTYDPPLSEVQAQGNPDSPKTPTTVSIQALGADGRPVRDARIEVSLTAPDPPTIVGSDVPRAEGLPLVRTSFGAPDGRQSFSTVLPIRGEYTLELRAEPLPGAAFAAFGQATSFVVNERPGETRLLILVILGLMLFGAVSAAVMARPHMRRRAASISAAGRTGARSGGRVARTPGLAGAAGVLGVLLLVYLGSLVVDGVNAASADREAAAYQGAGEGHQRSARSDGAELRYRVNRSTEDGISIQTLVETDGTLSDPRTAAPIPGAEIRIEVLDRETGKPAFTMQEPTAGGRFGWDVDYWDGVEYDTTISAVPAGGGPRFAAVRDTVENAVEPLSPPILVKFVGLSYLLLPVLIGMGIGVLFARRRWGAGPPGRRASASTTAVAQ